MDSGRRFPLIGQVVGEDYLVIDAIGEGPVTVSYEGKNCLDDRPVVVKALAKQHSQLADKFCESAQKLSKLKHKNIANPIWSSQDSTAEPCIVFESVESITLEELVESIGQIEDEDSLGSLLIQICDALEYAHHQQTPHGALSPRNILLLQRGDDIDVLIEDFNITSLLAPEAFETACGGRTTELVYAAPERYTNGIVTFNADVYSLGAIAYYMITGKPPYAAQSLDELKQVHENGKSAPPRLSEKINLPGVPQLDSLIQEALNTDPEWRLSTVSQFKERVRSWINAPNREADDFDDFDGQGFDALDDEDVVEDHEVDWGVPSDEPAVHPNNQNFAPDSSIPPSSQPTSIVPVSTQASPKTVAPGAPAASIPAQAPAEVAAVPPGVQVHGHAPQAVPFPKQVPGSPTGRTSTLPTTATEASHPLTDAPNSPVAFISTDADGFAGKRSIESDSRPHPPPPPPRSSKALPGFEPITQQEQQKLESMVLENAETKAALKKTARRKPVRKKKKMVTTTVRNLIALRQNQAEQSEKAAMQFTEHFSDQGTRQSPAKTLLRLVATILVFCASATFIALNFGEVKKMFFAASMQIEPLFRKSVVIEKDKTWEDAVDKATNKKEVATAAPDKVPPIPIPAKPPTGLGAGTITSTSSKIRPAEAPPTRALNPLEARTPLGSDYYSKGMFSRTTTSTNNSDSKLGNRRRIDYREFNMDWLK